MTTDDPEQQRWQGRFSTPDYVFGKAPNYFLAAAKPLLPPRGRALAVADGEGRNGVWLAAQGLDVLAIDYAPAGIEKARKLAAEQGVHVTFEQADMHAWAYPENAFDVVADIFTQVSNPAERAVKWAGIRRTLKPGGLLVLMGYTPKQLQHGTGGPKVIENLYTRPMIEQAFAGFRDMAFVEEERDMHEGAGHSGMAAVIGLTARK